MFYMIQEILNFLFKGTINILWMCTETQTRYSARCIILKIAYIVNALGQEKNNNFLFDYLQTSGDIYVL